MALMAPPNSEYGTWWKMALTPITVSVGGGRALDRAGLAALLASLPGFHVLPPGKRSTTASFGLGHMYGFNGIAPG